MHDRWADIKNVGWRFHITVGSGIVGGALLIVIIEVLSSSHRIGSDVRDIGLVAGGVLLGLVSLLLYEFSEVAPERARIESERESDRNRHQEERRLDFEQYRALQSELRESRLRIASLQAKLDLTGTLDRERVGDALLLGFYFQRRDEALPSSPKESVFAIAANRLKVLGDGAQIKLEKSVVHDVLRLAYGPIIAEAFDLGYLLSHLGKDGLPEEHSEVLGELESQLKSLRFNHRADRAGHDSSVSNPAVGLFTRLASRIAAVVRPKP